MMMVKSSGAFHLSEAHFSSIGLEGLAMAVADIVRLNSLGGEEAEERRQHVPRVTVRDLLQERTVTRVHGCLASGIGRLPVEPKESRPGVGTVIGEGLGVDPKPGGVELLDRSSGSGSGKAAD
jgi:hypothetical protein